MSNMKNDSADEGFTSKLDIHMVSTATARRLIDAFAGSRVVLAMMGPSGIGKTAIPKQAAEARDVPYVALHMPTMSIEDFHVPTKAEDSKQYYDRRIPRKFEPLITYIEKESRKHPGGKIPPHRCPILAIEELNRTVDKHVTRATFTLLDDRVIGDTEISDYIQIVVSMNPTGGGMAVNEFEKDPAMRRRLVIVGVAPSYGDFMRYAKDNKRFHPRVIDHLEAQPNLLYDTNGAKSGKSFACPATWEAVARLCFALDAAKIPLTSNEARAAFSGAIGATAAEVFIEYIQDATIVITPEEVLSGYTEKSAIRDRFQKLLKDSRQDKITSLASNVAMQLFVDTKRKPETYAKNLALFMEDLPEENTIVFIREMHNQSRTAKDGTTFLQAVNKELVKCPAFTRAVESMQAAQKKGKAEAAAS